MRFKGANEIMKRIFITMVALVLILVLLSAARTGNIFRVSDRTIISFGTMIEEFVRSDVILIGEIHDVQQHHDTEFAVIKALHEANTPLFIAMEMFRADSQKDLDAWTNGALSLDQFLPVYYRNWRMPWQLYERILLYAREHGIPVIGLNIPDRIVETVARRGVAALTEQERSQIPPGISCTIDTSYMTFIRKAYADHGTRDERSFRYFCEAQMLWDKAMAIHLIAALKANPGKKAVVIAGVGHAWRRGIPEQISLLSGYQARVALPVIPDQAIPKSVTLEDADYLVLD
jgi:uncharacterized iron-regulated protein